MEVVAKKREQAFDIAKGIGMLAVILGHMSIPNKLGDFIFSFHMPLFFLINGYFLKRKEGIGDWQYIRKKAKSLLVSYAVTCIFVLLFSTFFQMWQGVAAEGLLANAKSWVLASFYGSGTFTHFLKWDFRIIGAIWFLLAMFWADTIFYFLLKTKCPYLYGTILSLIGYFTTKMIWMPLSFQAGISAIFFIQIGHFVREKDLFRKYKDNFQVTCLAGIFWLIAIWYSGKLYMVGNNYGHGFLDVIGAISATYLILKFSGFLEQKCELVAGMLSFYGRNSLIVLCFHLVELNTFPWSILLEKCSLEMGTILVYFGKIIWSVLMIYFVYHIPVLSRVYCVQPKKRMKEGVGSNFIATKENG